MTSRHGNVFGNADNNNSNARILKWTRQVFQMRDIFEKVRKKRGTSEPKPEQFWSVLKKDENISKHKNAVRKCHKFTGRTEH